MADARPTPLTLLQAARLCLYLLFAPSRFEALDSADQVARKSYANPSPAPQRARIVRAAFFKSLLLVLAASAVGFISGRFIHALGRCATTDTVAVAQAIGAALLLWGTLFVRGWEIQSYSGVQFAERVNQWLYRLLYCVGTATIVYSLSFPLCAQ